MSDASLKLSDLLPSREAIDPGQLAFSGGSTLSTAVLGFVTSKLEESVAAALQADVLGLLALAWTKVSELREAAAEGREKDQPCHVYLGKHEIESVSKIDVQVEFAMLPGAKFAAPLTDELNLRLTATFHSVGLTINNGYIVSFEAGNAVARAELCYSNNKLLGRSTEPINLPVEYTLPHPVPIGLPGAIRTAEPVPKPDVEQPA